MPQTFNVGARSLFVTVTAWLFIVLGLMSLASALVQSAEVASLSAGLAVAGTPLPRPLFTGWLLHYLPWVVGAGLVLSAATLAAAIGLLLRLEVARRGFIVLLIVAMLLNLAGLWLQQEFMLSLVDITLNRAPMPPVVAGVFSGFVFATRSMSVVVTLASCAALGWIIHRLMSPAIRQEFA